MIDEASNVSTSLRWVRQDLDKRLEMVRLQLENVASNPKASSEAVEEVASNIRFLNLTFEALVLNGAVMVTGEMLILCDQIRRHHVNNKGAAFAALMEALVVIPAYLDRLQAGHHDLPILLLPVINNLRSSHNASLLQESAVFAPNLDVDLPDLAVTEQEETRNEPFADFAARVRQQYENALLNWLQEQDIPEHLSPLQGICETLLHRSEREDLKRLWWVASEVIGGLIRGFARNDAQIRRLFARLHLNVKALSEGGEDSIDPRAANALTRAFLFHVADSRKGNAGIDRLRKHFRLAELVPDQDELLRARGAVSGRDRDLYTTLGGVMKEELSMVKDALDLELRTSEVDTERREICVDALKRLQDTLKMLGLAESAQSIKDLLPAFLDSSQADDEARESSLMSLAEQLLVVESALQEQIETLGEPVEEGAGEGQLGLPAHEQRRIRDHLLEEMVVSTHQFQDAVKTRLGGDTDIDLDEPLQQVAGALHLIEEQEMAELTLRLANVTAYLLKNAFSESSVPAMQLESFTDAVAALELYLAACRDHQGNQSRFVRILTKSLDALPDSDDAERKIAEEEARKAEIAETRTKLASSVIKTVSEETPELDSAEDSLPPDVDHELLPVFLEEYEEVAETINDHIPLWMEKLDKTTALTEVRRGFHTLKGSGRMVGAYELGDFCWKIEALLNALLEGSIDSYADVAVMVRLAQASLPLLKQRLLQESVGLRRQAIAAIEDHAERLTRGEPANWDQLRGSLPAFQAGMLPGAALPDEDTHAPRRRLDQDSEGLRKDLVDNLAPLQDLLENVSTDRATRTTRDHLRAIHTLAGSLAMSPEGRDAEIARALEEMLEAQSNSGEPFSVDAIFTLGTGISHLQARLDRMEGLAEANVSVDDQHLLDQIVTLTAEMGAVHRAPVTPLAIESEERTEAGAEIEEEPAEPAAEAEEAAEEPAAPADVTGPAEEVEEELDSEIVEIFLEEAHEVLARSDSLLNTWRDDLSDLTLVQNLQREIHTFKGGARMAGLSALGNLSHAMESLLERIAGRSLPPSASAVQALEYGCDQLQAWVGQVAGGQKPQAGSTVTFFEQQVQDLVDVPVQPRSPAPLPSIEEVRELQELPEVSAPATNRSDERSGQIRVDADLLDSLVNAAGEVSIYRSRLEQQVSNLKGSLGEFDETIARLREQFRKLEIETEAQIRSRFKEAGDEGSEGFDPLELDRFSSMQQLSRGLSESVADLLNLQEMLDEAARQSDTLLTQQSRFTTELQEGLMKTRMVPFGSIAPRLRRLVRSAANETGKKARLQMKMVGTSDQLDRNVLERITAPLEHMLRNSIAHGIEKPETRKKLNKAAEGKITVTVESEATEFIIQIRDDGAGINREAIRKKALQLGMIDKNAEPPPQQLLEFILDSGFSTANSVTGLAGRGVGMDVVNSEIKQIGGSLEIVSEDGIGSCFTIRIPFTLAVMQALGVMAGQNRYLIPLTSVGGVSRMLPDDYRELLESEEPVYEFTGEKYPVFELESLLGEPVQPLTNDNISLLMIKAGDQRAAFRVPQLLGHREIVIKPVGPQISSVPGILGGTVNADGRVVVILDAGPLIRHARIHGMRPPTTATLEERPRQTLAMVVDDSITMRKVTSRVLESHQFEVITAKDGIDATEQMKQRVPDLLLLDIEMPRMDGFELASYVRANARLRHIPIVMITSRSGQKHRDRAAEVGANAYITKPYKESELVSQVNVVLGREA